MLARGVNHKWEACPRRGSTLAPVHAHIKLSKWRTWIIWAWLVLCYKRIGPPCCTLFTFITCYPLWIILSQNYLLPLISVLAENTLLKTSYHVLLLLVGFDTLIYRNELQLTPYTCGSSRLFSGAVSEEWSAFGKWNLVRKNFYSVLKFIVTCYYGKQSFEEFVWGIFTSSRTTIIYSSTYYTY